MGTDEESAAIAARSRLRRERMVAHRASGHADAEAWDLEFWQSRSPEERLSALVAIRRDVEAVGPGGRPGTTDVDGRANAALADFGSPYLLNLSDEDEILQLGVAPNRIDLLREAAPLVFEDAWRRRVEGTYGRARACWIAIEDLLAIKERIDHPRHQEDARVLRLVLERRRRE